MQGAGVGVRCEYPHNATLQAQQKVLRRNRGKQMNITISRVWRRFSSLALSFMLAAVVSVTGYAQDRIKPFVLAATSEVVVDDAQP